MPVAGAIGAMVMVVVAIVMAMTMVIVIKMPLFRVMMMLTPVFVVFGVMNVNVWSLIAAMIVPERGTRETRGSRVKQQGVGRAKKTKSALPSAEPFTDSCHPGLRSS